MTVNWEGITPDGEPIRVVDVEGIGPVEEHDDPRLRFRLWLDGTLIDEVWLDTSDPADVARIDQVRDRHLAIAQAANDNGMLWMVELYDPGAPPSEAYARIGTDSGGMVDPHPLG